MQQPRTENFLYMLDSGGNPGYRPNPRLARALEVMFILHQVLLLL
jgi:citrate synthase